MARRKIARDTMDTGTPEMARKFTVVPKLTSPTEMAMRVMDGTEIDKMLMRDDITAAEHGTLMTLAKRLHTYGYVGLKSPSYDTPIHADPELVADKKANIMRGAVHLIRKMDQHHDIGPDKRRKLLNLILEDAPWGSLRHQVEAIKFAIRALDDIFIGKG